MKLACLLIISVSISTFAQNVAVLTHGAANTPEFKRGCPGEFPWQYFQIGKATEVPRDLPSPPWIVETEAQLKARFQSLEAEKEAWNVAQENTSTQPKRDRDALIKQAKDELRLIRDSSGTLTGAQISNAVRSIARTLLAVIDELGH